MAALVVRPAVLDDADDTDVGALLQAAVTDSRVRATVIAALTGGVCLVAADINRIVGCVCVPVAHEGDGWVIDAIAVAPEERRRGIGQRLVREAIQRSGAALVQAETDKDAVDFYASLGFTITSLGEKYRGVERFDCRWAG